MHALLSSVMYILSGKKITAVYPMSRHHQNTTQVANRLNRARATYIRLLHVPPCAIPNCTLSLIYIRQYVLLITHPTLNELYTGISKNYIQKTTDRFAFNKSRGSVPSSVQTLLDRLGFHCTVQDYALSSVYNSLYSMECILPRLNRHKGRCHPT